MIDSQSGWVEQIRTAWSVSNPETQAITVIRLSTPVMHEMNYEHSAQTILTEYTSDARNELQTLSSNNTDCLECMRLE